MFTISRRSLPVHGLLVAASAAVALPYVWMLLLSVKPSAELFAPGTWLKLDGIGLQAYAEVFRRAPFLRWLGNSALVAVLVTAGQVATSFLAAYAFARFTFRGREALFMFVLVTMMVPPQTLMVPSYVLLHQLGWVNTFQGLIVPHLAWGFGIFMLRQFFLGVPRELADAAAIDGCGHARTLWHVYLPLSATALVALSVLAFVAAWNDYYWPLVVVTTDEMRTLPIGIPRFTGADLDVQWQITMAAATMGTLPVLALYAVAQRWFLDGVSRSGLKG